MFISTKNNNENLRPECSHYSICGGCQASYLLHDDYVNHKILNTKQVLSKELRSNLEYRVEYIPDDKDNNLRRRTIFSVKKNKIGFMRYQSHEVIDIDFCPVLNNKINSVIRELKITCSKLKNSSLFKVAINNIKDKIDIIFIATKKLLKEDVIILSALSNIDSITRVYWYTKDMEPIFIKEEIYIKYFNYNVPYPCGSFLQATEFGENSIKLCVENYINIIKPSNVVDLFCGLGGLSIFLSSLDTVKTIYAYDISKEAIKSLQSIKCNKVIPKVRDLFLYPILAKELNNIDTVIINPPRIGARKQIAEIAKITQIKNVIMIYCDIKSFCADIKVLLGYGFILYENKIKLIDQFKYSKHVELVAYLERV